MEVAIYRLVQEAFSNVLKHAEASFIRLEVAFLEKTVTIEVRDNGKGFNAGQMDVITSRGTHFGIMGMKERLQLLEGNLEIESAKEAGTRLMMEIPLDSKYREE
jgi:two-component system sensor histidine kinase DegS